MVTIHYFGLPLGFTIIILVLSILSLFHTRQTSGNSLVQIDTTMANVSNMYWWSFDTPVTKADNTTLGDSYKFGLWGYCSKGSSVNELQTVTVISSDGYNYQCTENQNRYYPNVLQVIYGQQSLQGGEWGHAKEFFNHDLIPSKSKSTNAFNGILGSLVISVIEIFSIILGAIVSFFFKKSLIGFYSTIVALSLAQWIAALIGATSLRHLIDGLVDMFSKTYDTLHITADSDDTSLKYAWVAFALGLINFVISVATFVFYILKSKGKSTVNKEEDEESHNEKESIHE